MSNTKRETGAQRRKKEELARQLRQLTVEEMVYARVAKRASDLAASAFMRHADDAAAELRKLADEFQESARHSANLAAQLRVLVAKTAEVA